MTDEESLLAKRFTELANRAYQTDRYMFTDFLGLAEQDVFEQIRRSLPPVGVTASGGTEGTERVMLRFGSPDEIGYEEPFPIVCLKAEPRAQKFADALTHRDFLGALMNLGIERATLGDIVIRDNVGYLFVSEKMADYIAASLERVKHTDVRLSVVADIPAGELYQTEPILIQAVGERVDAIIAKVFRISREDALDLFRKKLVFINGRVSENNSATPKPDDVITVRGFGRMIYRGFRSESKKGKLNLLVEKYI